MRYKTFLHFIVLLLFSYAIPVELLGQVLPISQGGSEYVREPQKACVSPTERTALTLLLKKNVAALKEKGQLRQKTNITPSLEWPLRIIPNQQFKSPYVLTNFVDHNMATASGSFNQYGATNQDYNCGNRSYDTNNGYNHAGIDVSLWPFEWYMYEHDIVEVIAAEAGTIVVKTDGHVDTNCSCTGQWNSIFVQHGDGSVAWYGHMKSGSLSTKDIGDTVSKGEYLGVVASSGCSTNPHLHFELHNNSINGDLIDPYAGPCNNLNSSGWWATQPAYREPTINALLTHSAPPVFGCLNEEETNFSNCFNPGQTVYTAIYYRDLIQNDITTLRLRQPNGTIYTTWNFTAQATYSGAFFYWEWTLPTSGTFGTWTLEADFHGFTTTYQFSYTNDDCSCPLSFAHSNSNNLTGTIATNAEYESFGMIQTDQSVSSNASITYDSGTMVCFENGMEVSIGASMEALIDGCGNQ